jgi:hypothetical protein
MEALREPANLTPNLCSLPPPSPQYPLVYCVCGKSGQRQWVTGTQTARTAW